MPYNVEVAPDTGRMFIRLDSEHFIVRTATVDDVSERWAGWLSDPIAAMMLNARPRTFSLEELRQYVNSYDQIDRLLMCIFDRASGQHIGVAIGEFLPGGRKARPVVLVGEPAFRSMGLLHEMQETAYEFFFEARKVDAIVSNVLSYNAIAIAFNESRGWKMTERTVGAKKSARTGEPIDVLVYEFTRDMWRAQREKK